MRALPTTERTVPYDGTTPPVVRHEGHQYDGTDVDLVTVVAGASRVLVVGARHVSSHADVGFVLVRAAGERGWVEGELPAGTDAITGVAFAPTR